MTGYGGTKQSRRESEMNMYQDRTLIGRSSVPIDFSRMVIPTFSLAQISTDGEIDALVGWIRVI